jgi:endonuclease YncB( thermonuclease family)
MKRIALAVLALLLAGCVASGPNSVPKMIEKATEVGTALPATVTPNVVVEVIDGDTVILADGTHVRLLGMDAPESDACGGQEASDQLASLMPLTANLNGEVDKYDRSLAYLETPDGRDAGYFMILTGYAIARYDSRDGYGAHPNEHLYIEAQNLAADHPEEGVWGLCGSIATVTLYPTPTPRATQVVIPPTRVTLPPTAAPSNVYYANCSAVRDAGAAPLYQGQPGYRSGLDRDHDGIACE